MARTAIARQSPAIRAQDRVSLIGDIFRLVIINSVVPSLYDQTMTDHSAIEKRGALASDRRCRPLQDILAVNHTVHMMPHEFTTV
jgi:hypothetical protein